MEAIAQEEACMAEAPLKLKIALGKHAHVQPLKEGRVASECLDLTFVEYDPLPKAFRNFVRTDELDVSEMALTTHLLALEAGQDITALPIPLWRRLHHDNLVCKASSDLKGPKDLEGRRVGVRAYSQTTGVWIRGILAREYGVDLSRITFVTMEDAHVPGFVDPANCVRNDTSKSLRDLLLDGDLAAIMGERTVDPSDVRPVIEDPKAAEAWSERTGIFPVNHIVSVRTHLLKAHPWLAGELMKLFDAARIASGAQGVAAMPYGLEPTRDAMQMLLDFAHEQGLTREQRRVDDVFPSF